MRVTFVLPCVGLAGGIRVVATYAQHLRRMGHSVCVISASSPTEPLRARLRRFVRGESPAQGPSHMDGVAVEHRVLERARAVCNADVPNADIVVATWWETAEWVAQLGPEKGEKVYLIQGYELHPGLPFDRIDATWRLPMKKVVVEEWLKDLAATKFGDCNATLIPNAVDSALFHAPERGKQTPPRVGLLYAREPAKGTDISLRAYELARQQVPTLELIAFGAVRPRRPLGLSPGAAFHYRPPQEAIRAIYSSCDAWLFASRSEGFGLPILEAMACRTPVIATPAGAAPAVVPSGGGVLVPHDDPTALASSIVEFARMPAFEWLVRSDAAEAAAARFSWDGASRKLEAVFFDLLSPNRSRSGRSLMWG